jgi:hypothetical protein
MDEPTTPSPERHAGDRAVPHAPCGAEVYYEASSVDTPPGRLPVNVKIEPMGVSELEAELRYYEAEFGMSSAAFVQAYRGGEAPEILEEVALEWVMAYEAWRLVAGDPETR